MEGFKSKPIIPNFKHVKDLIKDEDIFLFYYPGIIFNSRVKSPIGEKDDRPSFSVFWSNLKNKLIFKEFRYGYTGDSIDFVRYLFYYPDNTRACMRILRDFGKDEGFYIDNNIMKIKPSKIPKSSRIVKKHERADFKVIIRNWEEHDLEYWGKYGITLQWLKLGRIYPVKFFYIGKSPYRAEKYSYVYVENKDNNLTYKIYQPFSEEKKWLGNNDASIWELWELLPNKHDFLIITKSRKDALSIMSTCRIPSVSLQTEGSIPKIQVIDELKSRFKHILFFYDNDYDKSKNWGVQYVKRLSEEFNIDYILINEKYHSKDYSDFIDNHGIRKAKLFLWREIKNKLYESTK